MRLIKVLTKIIVFIIIIGILITVAGFIIGGVTFADFRNGFSGDDQYTAGQYNETLQVSKIFIDCEDNIINLVVSDDDKFNISYYESDDYDVTVTNDENVLSLQAKYNKRIWFKFRYPSSTVRTITVQVPSDYEGEILIKNSNGGIMLDSISNITNLDLRTSNGKVEVSNMQVSGNVDIRTSNGNITVSNYIVTGYIEMVTSNGKVNLNSVIASKVKAISSNGSINATGLESDNIDAATSNGSVELSIKGEYSEYMVDVSTSLGNIKVNGTGVTSQIINPSSSNKVKARTSNGSIDIAFE